MVLAMDDLATPDQDRAISLREAAIIQSFPDSYRFVEDKDEVAFSHLGTLIGNAVPPKLGEAIGGCILRHIVDEEEQTGDQLALF